MPAANLATVAQLAAFTQETIADTDAGAQLMLTVASGMVRDYLQQTITAVTGDVLLTEFLPGTATVLLPEWPITAVSLVEMFDGLAWSTVAPTSYAVSRRIGALVGRDGLITWPTDYETLRITYDHGFALVPDSLVGVCLGVAGRAYTSPISIDLERIGAYQVKYTIEREGFSPLELIALNRYREARVA
jgi:hypothetical protein